MGSRKHPHKTGAWTARRVEEGEESSLTLSLSTKQGSRRDQLKPRYMQIQGDGPCQLHAGVRLDTPPLPLRGR